MSGNRLHNVGKMVSVTLITLMLFLPVGCGTKAIGVDTVVIDEIELILSVGQVSQLTVSLFPGNSTNRGISWTSSDETVASVTSEGNVIANALGTATIAATAIDGGKSDECTVVVIPPTGLIIDPEDDEVVRLLKTHWQAMKDNDYHSWRATVLVNPKNTAIEFAITSLEVKAIWISEMETAAMQDAYRGSVLAQYKGWDEEFIKENMLIAAVNYIVTYDHTKVPYSGGDFVEPFILIRSDIDSPWLIWNIRDDEDRLLVLKSHSEEHDGIRALKEHWKVDRKDDYDKWSSFFLWGTIPSVTDDDPPNAVISSATYYFTVSDDESAHMQNMWHGINSLKERVGWAEDNSIFENMVVVMARHVTYYDGRKVFYFSGPGTRYYVLVRKSPDSPWQYKEGYSR